jgi:hypothetical protein
VASSGGDGEAARCESCLPLFGVGGEQFDEVDGRARRSGEPKRGQKRRAMAPPAFMELIAPASAGSTNCTLEVEAPQGGKLRLEWRAVSATELAELIRAFVSR